MAGEITRIALPGAAGRMGKMIRDLVAEKAEFEIAALTEHSDHPLVGSTTDLSLIHISEPTRPS